MQEDLESQGLIRIRYFFLLSRILKTGQPKWKGSSTKLPNRCWNMQFGCFTAWGSCKQLQLVHLLIRQKARLAASIYTSFWIDEVLSFSSSVLNGVLEIWARHSSSHQTELSLGTQAQLRNSSRDSVIEKNHHSFPFQAERQWFNGTMNGAILIFCLDNRVLVRAWLHAAFAVGRAACTQRMRTSGPLRQWVFISISKGYICLPHYLHSFPNKC